MKNIVKQRELEDGEIGINDIIVTNTGDIMLIVGLPNTDEVGALKLNDTTSSVDKWFTTDGVQSWDCVSDLMGALDWEYASIKLFTDIIELSN